MNDSILIREPRCPPRLLAQQADNQTVENVQRVLHNEETTKVAHNKTTSLLDVSRRFDGDEVSTVARDDYRAIGST